MILSTSVFKTVVYLNINLNDASIDTFATSAML